MNQEIIVNSPSQLLKWTVKIEIGEELSRGSYVEISGIYAERKSFIQGLMVRGQREVGRSTSVRTEHRTAAPNEA